MKKFLIAIAAALALSGCAAANADLSVGHHSGKVIHSRVQASYYGGGEKLSKHTANGERFNPGALTAAHRSLPFGTKVRVTNLHNNKFVIVKINDRGPAAWTGRHIDLSKGSASHIGMIGSGHAPVRVEAMR